MVHPVLIKGKQTKVERKCPGLIEGDPVQALLSQNAYIRLLKGSECLIKASLASAADLSLIKKNRINQLIKRAGLSRYRSSSGVSWGHP